MRAQWAGMSRNNLYLLASGTPLQYSCLENPMDGGAWWAVVHAVARSQDTTERLHLHFSLSCIGEGNGNPLQCSCLENPRDRGAWWAVVSGVAQSRTRLKRLSSNSSMTLQTLSSCNFEHYLWAKIYRTKSFIGRIISSNILKCI